LQSETPIEATALIRPHKQTSTHCQQCSLASQSQEVGSGLRPRARSLSLVRRPHPLDLNWIIASKRWWGGES